MKVLVIAPHMDDEALGAGGAIARHVAMGDHVTVCFVANRAYDHQYVPAMIERQKDAAQEARRILGYQKAVFLDLNDEQLDDRLIDVIAPIEECVAQEIPDWVYVNHRGDSNQDHRAVFQAALVACRSFAHPNIKRILSYEVPSSTDQAPPFAEYAFMPNCYVDIERYLEQKVRAMACYTDETRTLPHPRSAQGITVLAQKRGMEIGFMAAEAFALVREKLD